MRQGSNKTGQLRQCEVIKTCLQEECFPLYVRTEGMGRLDGRVEGARHETGGVSDSPDICRTLTPRQPVANGGQMID